MKTLQPHLTQLEASGLVRMAQAEPELEYLFRHALVQDAAYESLLKADRRILHHIVAETLERLYPQHLNELASTLGYHYSAAGETEQAHKYFMRAGDSALAQYANTEAEQHYRAALSLTVSLADKARVLSQLGEALFGQSRFEDAIHVWRNAIQLSQPLGDTDAVARGYARLARAAMLAGDNPRGLAFCREGLAVLKATEGVGEIENPGLAILLNEAGGVFADNGLQDEARTFCQQALAMAERLKLAELRIETLITLAALPGQPLETQRAMLQHAIELAEASQAWGVAAYAHNVLANTMWPDFQTTRQHHRQAAELYRRIGWASSELTSLNAVAFAAFVLGDFSDVEDNLAQRRRLLDTLTDPNLAAYGLRMTEAQLRFYRGEWAEALQDFQSLYQDAHRRGDLSEIFSASSWSGQAFLELDQWEQAEISLLEAIQISDTWSDPVIAQSMLIRVYCRQGRLADAQHLLAVTRARVNSQPDGMSQLFLLLATAEFAASEKHWAEAWSLFETLTNSLAQFGLRWLHAYTLREWAEAHLTRNEPSDVERARELLYEARAEFEAMNVSKYAALVNERLQTLPEKN